MLVHAEAMQVVAQIDPEIAKLTPIDVMMRAMTLAASAGAWDKAAQFASIVAPYLHPKLNALALKATVNQELDHLSDDQPWHLLAARAPRPF